MDIKTLLDQEERFAKLEADFQESRKAEVPTYCLSSFAEAHQILRNIRNNWSSLRLTEEMEQLISDATAALEGATERAKVIGPYLSTLVTTRSRVVRDGSVALRATNEFYESESRFYDVLRSVESQDLSEIQELATSAQRGYFEATLKALELGAVQRLADDVDFARDEISSGVYRMAQAEVEDLRNAVDSARTETLSLATLRARIVASSGFTRRLIDQGDAGPYNPDTDPPFAPPDDWAPGTHSAPDAPTTMRISERLANGLTVAWLNLAGVVESSALERSISDGRWEVVAEFSSATGWQSWNDTGLRPDTLHRYRVRTRNSYGSRVTIPDNQAVGYTLGAQNLPIWRVQLSIRIADVSDAGTGDSLSVRLNSPLPTNSPSSNRTWLDHAPRPAFPASDLGGDDFGRGDEWTYDLDSTYLRQLTDITMISLEKEGTNAIAIASVALRVNNKEVFTRYFGETSATCLWLDEGSGTSPVFTVYHSDLRGHPFWRDYVQSPPQFPLAMGGQELRERFEGIAGNSIHGKKVYWRTSVEPVRITLRNDHTLRVRLALAADINFIPNPDVDVSFDLVLGIVCNDAATEATLSLVSENVDTNADFNVLVDLLGLGASPAGLALIKYVEHLTEGAVKSGWEQILREIEVNPPIPGTCPAVTVDLERGGDLFVNFRPLGR